MHGQVADMIFGERGDLDGSNGSNGSWVSSGGIVGEKIK